MSQADKSSIEYLTKHLPGMINEIGQFIQSKMQEAYLQGYVDGQSITTNTTTQPYIKAYSSALDDGDIYERNEQGWFYRVNEHESFMKGALWPEHKFSIPGYRPVEVVNDRGDSFKLYCEVLYKGDNYILHGILPKPSGDILVSIGPDFSTYMDKDKSVKFTIANVNEIEKKN